MVAQAGEMVNGSLKTSGHSLVVLDEMMADLMRIWIHVEVLFSLVTDSSATY